MNISPFFIMATPRSGTTLLERLLNRHSQIFIPPETVFFYKLKQQGLLYKEFDLSEAKVFLQKYINSKAVKLLNLPEENILEVMLNNADSYKVIFENLMNILMGSLNKKYWGEKTPHHLHCIDRILEFYTDAKIIIVVRDGRSVVKSHIRQPNWSNSLIYSSKYWANDAIKIRSILDSGKKNILLVSYEDLVLNTEQELKNVCDFIGVSYISSILENNRNDNSQFSEYYNQEWMSKSVSNIDATRVDSWKNEYKKDELSLVESIMQEELKLFSYSLETNCLPMWKPLWFKEWLIYLGYRSKSYMKRKLHSW